MVCHAFWAAMHVGPQCIAAPQGFQKMMGMFIHLYRGVRTGAELSEIRLVDATRLARGAFSKLICRSIFLAVPKPLSYVAGCSVITVFV